MTDKTYKLIRAKKRDAEDIVSLVQEVIRHSLSGVYPPSAIKWFEDYHSVEALEKEFDGGAFVLCAYDGKRLVGTGTYYSDEIKRLFIHPEYQKAGIGKAVMEGLESEAKNRRPYVMLYANPLAVGYYKARGFEPIGIGADAMEDGEHLSYCMMEKNFVPRQWKIEKAKIDDAKALLEGQKKAFYEVAKLHEHMDMPPMTETPDEVARAIEKSCVFVVRYKNNIIGSVRGEEKDGACYISRLWVLPEHQGKGIAYSLTYAVEDEFKHLDKYKLFTGSKSEKTIDFYKERSFVEILREPCKGYELVYLEKMNATDLVF